MPIFENRRSKFPDNNNIKGAQCKVGELGSLSSIEKYFCAQASG